MKLFATIAIATILPFALASQAEARDSKHKGHSHSSGSKSKSSRGHSSHSHYDSHNHGYSRGMSYGNFAPSYGYHHQCQPGMVQIMVPGLGFVYVRPSDVGHYQVCR